MNETIKEYVDSYIPPVKMYYMSLRDAQAAWGEDFDPEDYI